MNPERHPHPTRALSTRVFLAWTIVLLGLSVAGMTGEMLENAFGITGRLRQGIHALLMSGIVLPGIWWLRTRRDGQTLAGLGFSGLRPALAHFGVGAGLVLVPMLLTIGLTLAFGWASIVVDLSAAGVGALAAGLLTVLFFEAIPEETAFRGYIYSNLSETHKRWVAGAITVALFVLLPVLLFPLQKYVLGMNASLGGANFVAPDYVITMVIFGSFVQYLRTQSGNIWTSIGFHAMFVLMNRIMSPRPSSFIRFTDLSSGQAIQLALIGGLLLSVAAAILYPHVARFARRRAALRREGSLRSEAA